VSRPSRLGVATRAETCDSANQGPAATDAADTALVHSLRDISLMYLSAHSAAQTSASGYITVGLSASSILPPNTPAQTDGNASGHSSNEAGESSQSGSGSSFIHVPHPHLRRPKSRPSVDATRQNTSGPSVGASTVRPSEKSAFLSSSDLDGDQSEDDEAWAEGNGWWNGVGLDQVDEVREGIRSLHSGLEGGKLRADEVEVGLWLRWVHSELMVRSLRDYC
jgi:hypothetical protein